MKRKLSVILALVTIVSALFGMNVFAKVSYERVEIKKDGQCVDSLDGVKAVYKKGVGNTNRGSYCCAGYVTKYYEKVHGITVSNMCQGRTPQTNKKGYTFKEVDISSAKKGDICYHQNSKGGGHWMIVKSASDNKVTVIEQNWKWQDGSKTMAAKNRTFGVKDYTNVKIFHLNIKKSEPTPEPEIGDKKSYNKWETPLKSYSTSTSNNITVYKTSTSTEKYGTVYGSTDELIIKDWTDNRVKVTYPTSSGSKTGWIDKSYISSTTPGKITDTYTASKKITTYKRKNGDSYGYISKGDKVYVVASSGAWKQVIYPISGGYKMGWIK